MLSAFDDPVSLAAVGPEPTALPPWCRSSPPALLEATLVLPAMSVCFAVSVWLPLASVELLIDQLPEPSAVVLPSEVVPLVS